ncbi:hypothetical protein [Spirosoma sp.]|uniref:hypothetical protein n=1 Tax=Spirosoma sp. TaxID=1899569 RepID=UPI002632A087|nr:hypothetical protein [Spirosoma sp.]MCX6216406.1 hypothetical protein [Spirosoma sp.]
MTLLLDIQIKIEFTLFKLGFVKGGRIQAPAFGLVIRPEHFGTQTRQQQLG